MTTLTASPYARDALFSIFPGGGYLLGNPADGALEVDAELTQAGIVLSVYDRVTQTPITRALYPLSGMTVSNCPLE